MMKTCMAHYNVAYPFFIDNNLERAIKTYFYPNFNAHLLFNDITGFEYNL